jgi:hypothetical protein
VASPPSVAPDIHPGAMPLFPKAIREPAARLGAAAQNALEVARFGGLDTGEDASPYEVVAATRMYRLRRYFPPSANRRLTRPPVILVPPMMLAADVYDVSPAASAVAILNENGVDPWVVDFGAPEQQEGGLERTLADHVIAVSGIVDQVRDATGRDVHLGGYSQGGMFCYQTAAYRRSDGVASVIAFGSPVDTRRGLRRAGARRGGGDGRRGDAARRGAGRPVHHGGARRRRAPAGRRPRHRRDPGHHVVPAADLAAARRRAAGAG